MLIIYSLIITIYETDQYESDPMPIITEILNSFSINNHKG